MRDCADVGVGKIFGEIDRGMREGNCLRRDAVQLIGETPGLVGFGGIAAEAARMVLGLKVIAWNSTPKAHPGVEFVPLERLLGGKQCRLASCCSTATPGTSSRANASSRVVLRHEILADGHGPRIDQAV